MVKTHFQHLVERRQRWFVRMVVPAGVREIVGQTIFMKTTGSKDQHQAALKAVPTVREFQERIRVARKAGKRLEQVSAENLAALYRAERESDPDRAELTKITDVIEFVLKTQGHRRSDYVRQAGEADNDLHTALRLLPGGDAAAQTADRITGHASPFLTCLEKWKPHAGLKPRPLNQASSSVQKFDAAVNRPLERIENADVQKWIDGLINPDGDNGLSPKTVNRKPGEINNYWRWLQSHQIVPEDRNPFVGRRVKEPATGRNRRMKCGNAFVPRMCGDV